MRAILCSTKCVQTHLHLPQRPPCQANALQASVYRTPGVCTEMHMPFTNNTAHLDNAVEFAGIPDLGAVALHHHKHIVKPTPIGGDACFVDAQAKLCKVLHHFYQGARAVGRVDRDNGGLGVSLVVNVHVGRMDTQLQRLIFLWHDKGICMSTTWSGAARGRVLTGQVASYQKITAAAHQTRGITPLSFVFTVFVKRLQAGGFGYAGGQQERLHGNFCAGDLLLLLACAACAMARQRCHGCHENTRPCDLCE